MKETPATDPRFDPRFQRGYEAPELPAPLPPAAATSVPDGARSASNPVPMQDTAVATDDTDVFWTPPRRNPFAIALLVGGLAMIAVGAWLIWTVVSASSYPDGYDRGEQAFALVQAQVTPALLICGVLAIVGWLVLGALAASARKRD